METCIIVTGNPVDGHEYVGPFQSAAEAMEYADRFVGSAWWIATIDPPAMETRGSIERKTAAGEFGVMAECHSDDRAVTAKFDAAPWLKQATDADIRALVRCGFGGDYPADDVAIWTANHDESVASMFEYLELRSPIENVGFECHVDEEACMGWIASNRKYLTTSLHDAGE